MKARDILRSVRVQRIDRSVGDAPNLGHLARTPGTGLPKGVLRRKKRGEGRRGNRDRNRRRKVLMTWSVVFAVAVLGVLVLALWLWLRSDIKGTREHAATHGGGKRVVSRFESPSEEVALDLVKHALMIREPAKVEVFFHPGSASSGEVVEFLREMEAVDGVVTGCDWLSSMDANGLLLDGVMVSTKAGDKPRNRLALLTPDETGRWKIDFDAFARTVKPRWGEFMTRNTVQGLVRVMVARDSYYNGPFRDETQWGCYAMASPDLDVVLLGYCRQGSPQGAAMERIVANGYRRSGVRGANRATLEIRRTGGGESRQFEITRVLAEDWVLSATAYDQKFK